MMLRIDIVYLGIKIITNSVFLIVWILNFNSSCFNKTNFNFTEILSCVTY